MNIDYVRLPYGGRLALRGIQDAKGGGHTGAMTGAMVATSNVFFPAAPLFILQKIQTSPGNYKLDTDDLLALKQAGLSDSTISAMMNAHSASQ